MNTKTVRLIFTSWTGDTLASGGDDGKLRMWKCGTTGEWVEFAEIDPASKYVFPHTFHHYPSSFHPPVLSRLTSTPDIEYR